MGDELKIGIGMYVRTNDGYIGKLLEIRERYLDYARTKLVGYDYIFDGQMWDTRNTDGYYHGEELTETDIKTLIVKPSFDILDLIKGGDYVNGHRVVIAGYNAYDELCVTIDTPDCVNKYIYPHEIKTILTKEVFEEMVYNVEGE